MNGTKGRPCAGDLAQVDLPSCEAPVPPDYGQDFRLLTVSSWLAAEIKQIEADTRMPHCSFPVVEGVEGALVGLSKFAVLWVVLGSRGVSRQSSGAPLSYEPAAELKDRFDLV